MVFLHSVRRFLVTTSAVPCSPILVTLMKEALVSSETSVITRVARSNIPEDAILQIFIPSRKFICLINFSKNSVFWDVTP
jgi:hypothetical protein